MIVKARSIIPFVLLLFSLSGCASLTPAQKTLWMANVYEAQYDLYLDQMINPMVGAEMKASLKAEPSLIVGEYLNPDLTEQQREVLRVKKQILIELKPLVAMATKYQLTGVLPSEEAINKMANLINELLISGD